MSTVDSNTHSLNRVPKCSIFTLTSRSNKASGGKEVFLAVVDTGVVLGTPSMIFNADTASVGSVDQSIRVGNIGAGAFARDGIEVPDRKRLTLTDEVSF